MHCCQYITSRPNHCTRSCAYGVPCQNKKLQSGTGRIASSPGYPSSRWSQVQATETRDGGSAKELWSLSRIDVVKKTRTLTAIRVNRRGTWTAVFGWPV